METPDVEPTDEQAAVVAAAAELLKAAILLRDIAGAAPADFLAAMPADILNRLTSYHYQEAFNGLPDHVQAAARELAFTDPDLQAARALGAAERRRRGAVGQVDD